MAIDVTTFKACFPEFNSLDDAVIQVWLDKSENYLCPDSWGDCYEDAVLLRAAHLLALSQSRIANAQSDGSTVVVPGGSGAIQSASVDGVSISYTASGPSMSDNNSEAWYSQTPYGQQFLSLRDGCISTIKLVGN